MPFEPQNQEDINALEKTEEELSAEFAPVEPDDPVPQEDTEEVSDFSEAPEPEKAPEEIAEEAAEETQNTAEEEKTEPTAPFAQAPYYGNFPYGNQPYGNFGQPGYPYYYSQPYYQPPKPPKEKLKTSVKVLLTVCVCLFVLFGASFFTYWALNGRENLLNMLTDNVENIFDVPDVPPFVGDGDQTETEPPKSDIKNNSELLGDFTIELNPNIIENNEASNARKAYEKVSASTVAVAFYSEDSDDDSDYIVNGSGVILSKDGYVLTNSHVINDGAPTDYKVILDDSREFFADLVGCDTRTDLAVLKMRGVENAGLVPAEFANSDELLIGEEVIAVGNPGGIEFQNSLSNGVVSALNREVGSKRLGTYIQTNAAINPGNSGGPLANFSGQVVGINTIKITATSYEGMGFAIPSTMVKQIAEDIIRLGYVSGRVKIGISGNALSKSDAENYGLLPGIMIH